MRLRTKVFRAHFLVFHPDLSSFLNLNVNRVNLEFLFILQLQIIYNLLECHDFRGKKLKETLILVKHNVTQNIKKRIKKREKN